MRYSKSKLAEGNRRRLDDRFPSGLKNQFNRRAKVRHALFRRPALTVRARPFGAVCDMPWAILLDYRRELVAHFYILSRKPVS